MTGDFHVHTNLCDGADSPEEMVLAAIDMGLEYIGFSGHSYTDFDQSYCMSLSDTARYVKQIADLKEKYHGKIKILCGIEQDYYSLMPTDSYDYVIGSVHYIKAGGNFIPIDESPEIFASACRKYFGGDFYAVAELYFEVVSDVVRKTGANIIGHFDLISKFNEKENFFDERDCRYVSAYRRAADSLVKYGVPFEVNTGAMSRGYKSCPYPSADILKYIRQIGGSVILSGDSHSAGTLCYNFEKTLPSLEGMKLVLTPI